MRCKINCLPKSYNDDLLTVIFNNISLLVIITCSSPLQPPAAPSPDEEAPPAKKPTRLAIGVEGGFDGGVEKVEYEEQLSVVAMPERASVSLPNEQLPQKVGRISLSLSLSLSRHYK